MSDWRDISTAKQDIREPDILLYGSYEDQGGGTVEFWSVGRWASCTGPHALLDGWEDAEGVHPDGFFSHWQPLDAPLTTTATRSP